MPTTDSKQAQEKPFWWPAKWNVHDPAQFAAKLEAADEDELRKLCNSYIWLSAYANNNPRSDYHWMCDAAYAECERRGKGNIYAEEHTRLARG